MPSIGAPELLIILAVLLLLFGGAKLPKLAKSLREARDEFQAGTDEPDKPAIAPNKGPAEAITMSKADLEALIAEREAKARREAAGSD